MQVFCMYDHIIIDILIGWQNILAPLFKVEGICQLFLIMNIYINYCIIIISQGKQITIWNWQAINICFVNKISIAFSILNEMLYWICEWVMYVWNNSIEMLDRNLKFSLNKWTSHKWINKNTIESNKHWNLYHSTDEHIFFPFEL